MTTPKNKINKITVKKTIEIDITYLPMLIH